MEKLVHFIPFLMVKPSGSYGINFMRLIELAVIAIVTAVLVNKLSVTKIEERLMSIERIMQHQTVNIQRDIDRLERNYENMRKDILRVQPR